MLNFAYFHLVDLPFHSGSHAAGQRRNLAEILVGRQDGIELELIPGLQDLYEVDGYMGGLVNGLGLHKCPYQYTVCVIAHQCFRRT